MQKCICIPVEQYELMLEAYDKVIEELAAMKKTGSLGSHRCRRWRHEIQNRFCRRSKKFSCE